MKKNYQKIIGVPYTKTDNSSPVRRILHDKPLSAFEKKLAHFRKIVKLNYPNSVSINCSSIPDKDRDSLRKDAKLLSGLN